MRGSQRRLSRVRPRLRRLGRRRQRQRPEPRGHHRPRRQRRSRAERQHQRPAAAMAWSPRSGSAPRALRRPPARALCACARACHRPAPVRPRSLTIAHGGICSHRLRRKKMTSKLKNFTMTSLDV
ncbi:uncharacterized protein LOC143274554 [Peromyscus maniculatus bairdii]|uniref:uncharacterized protein LOC143274554 n=1 Tax=Peromyscus maniculatus bairdii TaxID=230844 RepID=UPI003FD35231